MPVPDVDDGIGVDGSNPVDGRRDFARELIHRRCFPRVVGGARGLEGVDACDAFDVRDDKILGLAHACTIG